MIKKLFNIGYWCASAKVGISKSSISTLLKIKRYEMDYGYILIRRLDHHEKSTKKDTLIHNKTYVTYPPPPRLFTLMNIEFFNGSDNLTNCQMTKDFKLQFFLEKINNHN